MIVRMCHANPPERRSRAGECWHPVNKSMDPGVRRDDTITIDNGHASVSKYPDM